MSTQINLKEHTLKLTPTEQRILTLLDDGMPHTWDEMIACLYDNEMGDRRAVARHITRMRPRLNALGRDIVCVSNGTYTRYQQVRLLHNPTDGRV